MNQDVIIESIRICQVVSKNDPNNMGYIQVRFNPEDNDKKVSELPNVIPFLPKMLGVYPHVGELVLVMNTIPTQGYSQRFYIGPIISQLGKINYDPHTSYGAESIFRGSESTTNVNPKNIPEAQGTIAEDNTVSILGRKNSDIEIHENDLRLRSGVKIVGADNDANLSFNEKNPAFIKLKYNEIPQNKDNEEYNSTASIVADKVFILGNNPKDGNIITTDRKELITDNELNELIDKAHELPYGDKLVEFLKMFVNVFAKHVHPFSRCVPCETEDIVNLKNYDLNDILSNSVRIN